MSGNDYSMVSPFKVAILVIVKYGPLQRCIVIEYKNSFSIDFKDSSISSNFYTVLAADLSGSRSSSFHHSAAPTTMSTTASDEPVILPEAKNFLESCVSIACVIDSGYRCCPICHDFYGKSGDDDRARPVKFTNENACNHIFCSACIDEWIQVQGRNTCPMCRCVLYHKEEEDEEEVQEEDHVSESVILVAMAEENKIPHGLRGETVDTETFSEYTIRLQLNLDAVYTIRTTPGLKSKAGWEIRPEQWITTTQIREVLVAVWDELWERFMPYRNKIHHILSDWYDLRQCYLEKWDHAPVWRSLNKELRLQKIRLNTPKVVKLREMWLGYTPVELDDWILTDMQWMVVDEVLKKMYDLMTLEIWNMQMNSEFPREFMNKRCWDVERVFKEVDASGR